MVEGKIFTIDFGALPEYMSRGENSCYQNPLINFFGFLVSFFLPKTALLVERKFFIFP